MREENKLSVEQQARHRKVHHEPFWRFQSLLQLHTNLAIPSAWHQLPKSLRMHVYDTLTEQEK